MDPKKGPSEEQIKAMLRQALLNLQEEKEELEQLKSQEFTEEDEAEAERFAQMPEHEFSERYKKNIAAMRALIAEKYNEEAAMEFAFDLDPVRPEHSLPNGAMPSQAPHDANETVFSNASNRSVPPASLPGENNVISLDGAANRGRMRVVRTVSARSQKIYNCPPVKPNSAISSSEMSESHARKSKMPVWKRACIIVAASVLIVVPVSGFMFPQQAEANLQWVKSFFTKDYKSYTQYTLEDNQMQDYIDLAVNTEFPQIWFPVELPESYALFDVASYADSCSFIFKRSETDDLLVWTQRKINSQQPLLQADTEDVKIKPISVLGMPGEKTVKGDQVTYEFHNDTYLFRLKGTNITDKVMQEVVESIVPITNLAVE